jgi:hypothetical protein
MAAIDFPASPSTGTVHTDARSNVWVYDGIAWQSLLAALLKWPAGPAGMTVKGGSTTSNIGMTGGTGAYIILYDAAHGVSPGYFRIQASLDNTIGGKTLVGKPDGTLEWDGSTVWRAANDGASSGLDADLLDGEHGSYYRDAANLNAGTIPDARISTSTWPARTTSTWTPTLTANAGGPPTYTVNNARWERHGNIKFFYIDISVTALNGSSGFYNCTLADTVTYAAIAHGRNEAGEWIMGRCPSSSATMIIQTAAGGFPTGATHQLILRGSYEM